MPEFNFDEMNGSPQRKLWLMANKDKPLTEAEFTKAYKELRQYSSKPGSWGPSAYRYHYRRLREKFGFFPQPERPKVDLL